METVDPWRFLFAFLFVLALIGIAAGVLRRYSQTASGRLFLAQAQKTGGRLQVVEMRMVDARRKLVLVRRDGVEHILLLADNRELVIESPIYPSQAKDCRGKIPQTSALRAAPWAVIPKS